MISDASAAGTKLSCIHSLPFFAGRIPRVLSSGDVNVALFRLLELVVPYVNLPLFRAVCAVISEQLKVLCEACHLFQQRFFHCSALLFPQLHLAYVPFRPDVRFDLVL
jgi:hypothetical protein